MSENCMPLILVSAIDLETASKLISEIIDHEVTEDEAPKLAGRVWRLVNKYYRADVELRACTDATPPPAPALARLEAHVLHAAEAGEAAAAAAERRAAAGARASVRLVVAPGARVPPALAAWARRRGYEPVALAARAEAAGEAAGMRRVREALHAHTWRGLQRLDRAPAAAPGVAAADGGEADEDEGGCVERAEAFAAALGALEGARGDGAPAPSDEERRRRAERVLAAFCRALGADLQL